MLGLKLDGKFIATLHLFHNHYLPASILALRLDGFLSQPCIFSNAPCSYNYYLPASILGLKLDGSQDDAARLELLRTAWERFQGTHVSAGVEHDWHVVVRAVAAPLYMLTRQR